MAQSIAGVGYKAADAGNSGSGTSPSAAGNTEVNKDLFLKLMVAQLRNQNPLNPVDGTNFLEQLSQISGVEQMVEMRKELQSIHQLLETSATTSTTEGQ
jgi:flagellar basal-body rod modification protein FlgD